MQTNTQREVGADWYQGPARVLVKGWNKGRPVRFDSLQYEAIVRVRYRRWIAKRGIPQSVFGPDATAPDLRRICLAILNAKAVQS